MTSGTVLFPPSLGKRPENPPEEANKVVNVFPERKNQSGGIGYTLKRRVTISLSNLQEDGNLSKNRKLECYLRSAGINGE